MHPTRPDIVTLKRYVWLPIGCGDQLARSFTRMMIVEIEPSRIESVALSAKLISGVGSQHGLGSADLIDIEFCFGFVWNCGRLHPAMGHMTRQAGDFFDVMVLGNIQNFLQP